MLTLFMVIGAVSLLSRTAKAKGLSGWRWGWIGALCYFFPVLLISRGIYPALVEGKVTQDNALAHLVAVNVISMVVGFGCCGLAMRALVLRKGKEA